MSKIRWVNAQGDKIFTVVNIKLHLMSPSWGVTADVVHFFPTNLGHKHYMHIGG